MRSGVHRRVWAAAVKSSRLTITIPEDLARRLTRHRATLNVSGICAIAIRKMVDTLDRERHLRNTADDEDLREMAKLMEEP